MAWMKPFRGPRGRVVERSGSEIVGIILAMGIAGALNIITLALVWDVVSSPDATAPLSENTTQVLTGWGGGMLAVLGAYVGYTFGKSSVTDAGPEAPDIEEEPPPPKKPKTPTAKDGPQQKVSQQPKTTSPTLPPPDPATRYDAPPPGQ